ncbi:MAG: hypothetical protein NC339_06900 [Muribaculaceae bacterium]|nr:hypothetical protein [Muribaculaceae bacterium]
MKKIFTLLAVAALAVSAKAEVKTVDVTVTWPMAKAVETGETNEDGTPKIAYEMDLTPVVTEGLSTYLTVGEPTLGANLKWGTPRKTQDMVEALVQPLEQVKEATDGHSLSFKLAANAGYTFEPTSLTFQANVIGTSGGYYNLSYTFGGDPVTLTEGFHPNRNNEENGYYSNESYALSGAASANPLEVTFMIYSLADNKQMGFANVTIAGKLTGDIDLSGIADVVATENAPVEYFNLQGVRVENPANGLYIRRQGATVSKVLVK